MNDIPVRAGLEGIRNTVPEQMRTAIMALLLLATWSLCHRYKGLTLDGELYAFQALARLNPALRGDLYLMANSQDEFTFFSPLYALFIRAFGLWNASVTLFVLCSATFLMAARSLARSLWNADAAWLTTATGIVIICGYGAYGVFTYAENYLTARSMAEAMVVVAIACHFRGFHWWSWTIAAASMLIHPLMALPGLLLLICLSVPILYAVLGALLGVLTAISIAGLALSATTAPHFLMLISGEWLEVVRERSQFLFLQYWHMRDWGVHAHAALCLVMAAIATDDPRVRRLCFAGIVVGVTGLVVALIASNIGPVAILLQGQAWRWFWITGFISVLTLAPTALTLWRHPGCGSLCATLLVASWIFPTFGSALSVTAVFLWLARLRFRTGAQKLLQLLAFAIIVMILAWVMGNIWTVCFPSSTANQPSIIERLRGVYALQIPALFVAWLGVRWLRSGPSRNAYLIVSVLLFSICCMTLPGSFSNNSTAGSAAEIKSLSHWREAIPATSNVLFLPSAKSAAFIWFSLQRSSYLTVGQSAGVVFSRVTALEVRRRSEVLLPVMQPDWKIMTQLADTANARALHKAQGEQTDPLTPGQLSAICRDQQLDFVIAREQLGFNGIQNDAPGPRNRWNLYECSQVRQGIEG